MQQGAEINVKSYKPIGPLSELIAKGLNPAEWASCGRPVVENGRTTVIGCDEYDNCTQPFRDKGPHNGGVRVVGAPGTGGTMRDICESCYGFCKRKRSHEVRGGIVTWIKDEGEEIWIKGSKKVMTGDPANPFLYEDVVTKITIPNHPHLDDSAKLVDAQLEMKMREDYMAVERQKLVDRKMGVDPNFRDAVVTPLDAEGEKANDAGKPVRK